MAKYPGILRRLINSQIYLSQVFDRMLPEHYRIDGNQDFQMSFTPKYLQKNLRVYDVGGGKNPFLTPALKNQFALTVVGLDIDQNALACAPPGAYDDVICADITHYTGNADADLVICQALLEHVANVAAAFAGITSLLKPGGIAVLFTPSKNAIYARLNLLIPEHLKRTLLYAIFPQTDKNQGFRSYYDRCTPKDFEDLANRHGLEIVSKRLYFLSSYFSFCFPGYVFWRGWLLFFHLFAGDQAAETFAMALRKT